MAERQSTKDRFESKFEIVPFSGCWIYLGYEDKDGYGKFSYKNQQRPAHRVSWMLYKGEIPDDMSVLHHCDTPACVNPNHLFLGSQKENCHDAMRKNRNVKGEASGMSKLTEEDVREILTHSPTWSNAVMIAQRLGVTPENISMILRRKTWTHVKLE